MEKLDIVSVNQNLDDSEMNSEDASMSADSEDKLGQSCIPGI